MITWELRWCLMRCSPPVCAPPTSLGQRTAAEESLYVQFGFLKHWKHFLRHRRKKYSWTSPDAGNTKRCDEEAGES